MIVSENGEQLHKNKVWKMGVRVVKSGVLKIITYGPYVKSGIMLIRWCGKVERQSISGVVKIGIEGSNS